MLLIYSLADRLGKSVVEILAMPENEIEGWIAYLSHLNRAAKVGRAQSR